MDRKTKKIWISVIAALILIFLNSYFLISWYAKKNFSPEKIDWGVTFSKPYAQDLELDWKKTYLEMLEDMKISVLRLPAYWSEIEPQKDKFDFKDLDWQIDQAAKKDIKVTLVIGRKQPRWPECWVPDWTKEMSEEKVQERITIMLRKVVEYYKDNPTILYWQLENEPLVGWFGECPAPPDKEFLQRELAIVQNFDARLVIITDSGELSSWYSTSKMANLLGVTMYRVVWSNFFYFHWPVPPSFYQLKALFLGVKDRIINTELQAEPWPPQKNILKVSLDEQFKSMNLRQLEKNLDFARETGFPQVYVWGVEWWYWLKESRNESSFVDYMKEFFEKEHKMEYY